jgi:hypothetical protein
MDRVVDVAFWWASFYALARDRSRIEPCVHICVTFDEYLLHVTIYITGTLKG